MKNLIILITSLLAAFQMASAQVVPTPVIPATPVVMDADGAPASLPFGSFGQLKSYAVERITGGDITVYSSSMVYGSGTVTNYSETKLPGESPETFITRVLHRTFKFKLFDLHDSVYVYADFWGHSQGTAYYTREYYCTAFAAARIKEFLDGSTGFDIPNLLVHLSEMIAIPSGNITNAQLFHRNDAGQLEYVIPVLVQNGMMYVWTRYAGQGGQIVAQVSQPGGGSKQVVYSLGGNGERVIPTDILGMVNGSLDNYFEATVATHSESLWHAFVTGTVAWNTSPPVLRVVVENGEPGALARIKIGCAILDEGGGMLGTATQVFSRLEGEAPDSAKMVPVNPSSNWIEVSLPAGVHYLSFDSPHFDGNHVQPSIQDGNNGGKGGPEQNEGG